MEHVVAVSMFTYNRPDYAEKTIRLLREGMDTGNPCILHLADDGSDDQNAIENLRQREENSGFWNRVTLSNTLRRGYGASYNAATYWTHNEADIHIPIEDDWELRRPFALDPLIAALDEAVGEYDCIRLGYLGWTQELRAKLVRLHGQAFLALDPASQEPHVFSGHPRIETRDRQRRVGLWPEGMPAGATEFEVCHRASARKGVLWPVDLIPPMGNLFGHFGAVSFRGD